MIREIFMEDNFNLMKGMVMEFANTKVEKSIRENGKKAKKKEKEKLLMKIKVPSMVIGQKDNLMGLGMKYLQMELLIKVIG